MKSILKAAHASGQPEVKMKKRGFSAPITDEEKIRIKELKEQGLTDREVAEMVGRSTYTVGRVMRKRKEAELVKDGMFDANNFKIF
jgi:IS30 family transposase